MNYVFECQGCKYQSDIIWTGKVCPNCFRFYNIRQVALFQDEEVAYDEKKAVSLNVVEANTKDITRLETGIEGFDYVVGDETNHGLVPASVVLLTGDPGRGKSTLALQLSQALSRRRETVLYISAEEGIEQIALRSKRLGKHTDRLMAISTTDFDKITEEIEEHKPALAVIDSISTIELGDDFVSGQEYTIRKVIQELCKFAKLTKTCMLVIGHVTKEGVMAGPQKLAHAVDTTLHLSGGFGNNVFLKTIKNRFGPIRTNRFEMLSTGLRDCFRDPKIDESDHNHNGEGSEIHKEKYNVRRSKD